MQYTVFALPSIVSAAVMFLIFIYVLIYRRYSAGAWQFIGMMVCCSTWAFGYAMSLMCVELENKIIWFNLAQIGPDFAPLFWFLLSLEHIGRNDLVRQNGSLLFLYCL